MNKPSLWKTSYYNTWVLLDGKNKRKEKNGSYYFDMGSGLVFGTPKQWERKANGNTTQGLKD